MKKSYTVTHSYVWFSFSSKRLVPAVTFTLHAAHCERFIQLCEKCEEPIPKSQIEQHGIEIHCLVQCKDCNQQYEKGFMDDHVVSILFKRDCMDLK